MAVFAFADQSRRYDRYYPGRYVSGVPYRGVAHTTETTGLPSYAGGAEAPHLTIDPRHRRCWQHFDTARPARALEHRPGTIDTNNMRAVQVEIICYSDPTKVGSSGLYVGNLTAAELGYIAEVFAAINKAHRIPARVLMPDKPYPSSYGDNNGVRFSDSAWKKASGWCEHQNVPHNNHGDAGSLNLHACMALPAPTPVPTRKAKKMEALAKRATDHAIYHTDGTFRRWVQDTSVLKAMVAAGVPSTIYQFADDAALTSFAGPVQPGTVDFTPPTS